MNHARALIRRLRRFIPEVAMKDCMVSAGPGTDAHKHSGRVALLVGSATWAFMLLDVELFKAATLVRPVASAGQSVCGAHPSWADNVGAGGAPHPSFAAQSLAREATVRERFAGSAHRVVPFAVFTSIDGTKAGTTVGRASLTPDLRTKRMAILQAVARRACVYHDCCLPNTQANARCTQQHRRRVCASCTTRPGTSAREPLLRRTVRAVCYRASW